MLTYLFANHSLPTKIYINTVTKKKYLNTTVYFMENGRRICDPLPKGQQLNWDPFHDMDDD